MSIGKVAAYGLFIAWQAVLLITSLSVGADALEAGNTPHAIGGGILALLAAAAIVIATNHAFAAD